MYKHKEAFCLMYYKCDKCNHFERIWNSRDGVTPFGVKCPSCEFGVMNHAYFGSDQRAKDFEPAPGQKFFRDGTQDEAVGIITRRIAAFRAHGHDISDAREAAMLADAASCESQEFRAGWPVIDIVPYEYAVKTNG